ncbi:MAG: L-lactate dehydrogenase complex protein LldE [Verrucomicrobiales bacterium]|jgi:L-lactate dehydrogenase complex protein LldE
MATCLCDAFFDSAAQATYEVLEHLDCEIDFPEAQTCCGQPAFNSGDWKASRKVVRHTVKTFEGAAPIVVPSGSCAAMMYHGAPLEFEGEDDLEAVNAVGRRTWELADYVVNGLGVESWPGSFPHRIAFHRSCHSRGTKAGEAAQQLLSSIDGLEVVEFGEQEQCCGFGGAFSVTFPHLSGDIGQQKLDKILENKPEYLVSADMGCLMHLGGMIGKQDLEVKPLHIAEILVAALKAA